ncbi:hypothetical protein ACEWY4_003289 [Coilia grayii]|uniref:Inositol 1,4,5-trisphosphate receptor-interacting protein-like 2 n=1 Tax=Coilia grayii TaxID=363190 RepID=A0ABD1KQV6_9TELE
MSVYTLNLRVFWPLLTCVLAALLLLHHLALRDAETSAAEDGCRDPDPGALSLLKYVLAFALCYFFIRHCASRSGDEGKRAGLGRTLLLEGHGRARRELLEEYYEREVRLSPHVLGHSKAHVAKLVSELVKVGRTDGPPESSLAFRGDHVQIGSSYEEHKVGSPDCFDILVPLRLPRGLVLDTVVFGKTPGGPPLCTMETPRRSDWTRKHRTFCDGFLRQHASSSSSASAAVQRLSPDCVLRWFYPAAQRCLAAVRYPFDQRCALSLSLGEEQRVQLRLTPRSDYVCCHISMGVRLIPAFPLGDSAFLVPATDPRHPGEDLWAVYFPKQEQRLLGWLKGRLPSSGSCHLKVLQLAKEVRDLGGQTLDNQARAEWKGVLSSYALKTAWLRLLLATPAEAWEERHLVERLEDLLRGLRDGLQGCVMRHLFLGGDAGALLPDSVALALPKLVKDAAPSNLWEGSSQASLELVAARLSYTWAHLHRLIRLGRPQRSSLGRGLHCKHIEAE